MARRSKPLKSLAHTIYYGCSRNNCKCQRRKSHFYSAPEDLLTLPVRDCDPTRGTVLVHPTFQPESLARLVYCWAFKQVNYLALLDLPDDVGSLWRLSVVHWRGLETPVLGRPYLRILRSEN